VFHPGMGADMQSNCMVDLVNTESWKN